jgi:hypothetical protein
VHRPLRDRLKAFDSRILDKRDVNKGTLTLRFFLAERELQRKKTSGTSGAPFSKQKHQCCQQKKLHEAIRAGAVFDLTVISDASSARRSSAFGIRRMNSAEDRERHLARQACRMSNSG